MDKSVAEMVAVVTMKNVAHTTTQTEPLRLVVVHLALEAVAGVLLMMVMVLHQIAVVKEKVAVTVLP